MSLEKMKCFLKSVVCVILSLVVLASCKEEPALPRPSAYWSGTTSTGLSTNVIHDLIIDKSGNLWAAFYEGRVGKYDGTGWELLIPRSVSSTSSADMLFQDSQGNIWAAVREGFKLYACKFDGENWTSEFLSENAVNGITELANGNILFAMDYGGGYVFDGTDWSLWDCYGHCLGGMDAVFTDKTGVLWIGMRGNKVLKYDGATYSELDIPMEDNSSFGADVVNFSQGSSGDVIACLDPGTAWRMKDDSWERIIKDPTYEAGPALAALEDSKGRVWIGTSSKGVILVDGDKLVTYTINDKNANISGIVENKNGDIFLGNAYGLFVYKYY